MINKDYYDIRAKYYDILISKMYFARMRDKYLSFLRKNLNGLDIIEFGCGTGFMSIPLAKAGFNILGVELNNNMLNVAKKKAKDVDIKFAHGNMQTYKTDRKFDSAVATYNVIMENQTKSNTIKFLKNAYNLLKENGVLMFDCENYPNWKEYKWEINQDFEKKDGIKISRNMKTWKEDNKIYWGEIANINDNGKEVTIDLTYCYPIWKYEEIIEMIKKASFTNIKCFDLETGKKANEKSKRFYFVVKK